MNFELNDKTGNLNSTYHRLFEFRRIALVRKINEPRLRLHHWPVKSLASEGVAPYLLYNGVGLVDAMTT